MNLAWKSGALRELLIWPFLAFLCFALMARTRAMPLSDDSYQYLNVAGNFIQGKGVVTALVHFDSERSHGRVPAPLTTFPPAYPIAIAVVSHLAGSLENTGRLLSGVGYAATAALLTWSLLLLDSGFFARLIVLLIFIANAVNLSFATAVLTESTYMLVSMGAVLGLIALEKGPHRPYVDASIAVFAYALTGLSYYIRYAGLFLIIAVTCFTLLQFVRERNRLRTVNLILCLIPVLFAGAIMLRNIAAVGSWRGGNDLRAHNPLPGVAADYVRAQVHLILGQHALRFGFWEALLLVGALGVAAFLIVAIRNLVWPSLDSSVLLIIVCVGVYSAGIFYAGLETPISFGTRMFLPILPLYLLLLGLIVGWLADRWRSGWRGVAFKLSVAVAMIGYLGSNQRDLRQPPTLPEYEVLRAEFAEPIPGGEHLLDWVQSHISPASPVFAEDGQATGYLLQRPTVSLVGPRYSSMRWNCEALRKEMRRFRSSDLILYKTSSNIDDRELLASSSFLAGALASPGSTCGFVSVAENPDVRVFELTPGTE